MKYFSTPLLLFLLLFGCKDKSITKSYCEENPGGCESVMEAKKFFVFTLGSWWVYEEETTHQRDSVYVTDYYNAGNYDFDIRTHSTLEGYNYHYWPTYVTPNGCSSTYPVQKKCIFINRSKGKSGNFVGQDFCFFVNYSKGAYETIGGNIYFSNNKIIVDEIYGSYELGNYTFNKTIKIKELSTRVEGIQPTNHYYTKGVGLIRRELLDSNQVWNLIGYHIEP